MSAACGFRVFVPLLVMSIASKAGHLTLAPGFDWIGSYPAMLTFSVAAALEIAGYFIPWFDHCLDVIATPASVVAGTVVTASLVTGASPYLRWTLAAIAGGGVAGMVQGATVATRGASTATTGGLANPLVATLELAGALITSIAALFAPVVVVALIGVLAIVFGPKLFKKSAGLVRALH